MSTLGIVGGIAPESTIQYYRLLVEAYRRRIPDGRYPSIVIDSIDMTKMLGLIGAGQLAEVTRYLLDEIGRLEGAGADVCLLASNTPHIVFDELRRGSPLPLISIVEAACGAAQALRLRRVALFGTRFTMTGGFYADVFSRSGITVVAPNEEEQATIHDRYMGELVEGVFRPETREQITSIARAMRDRDAVDGLVLGGTELPLLFGDDADVGMPVLDTTRIHVDEAIEWLVR